MVLLMVIIKLRYLQRLLQQENSKEFISATRSNNGHNKPTGIKTSQICHAMAIRETIFDFNLMRVHRTTTIKLLEDTGP